MKIKVLLLTLILILLCGCEEWDNIYSEYSDVLDDGYSCTYHYVKSSEGDYNPLMLETIEFTGSKSGVTVSYNGATPEILFDENNFNNISYINNFMLVYNDFNFDVYLQEFETTGVCPTNLYMYFYGADYYINSFMPSNIDFAYMFSTKSTSGNNQSGGNDDITDPDAGKCHIENAIECTTKRINTTDGTVYIELGFERLSNGDIGRYYVISDRSDLIGGVVARDAGGLVTQFKGNTYMLEYPEEIYFNNNGNYSFSNIVLRKTNTGGHYFVYYIYAEGSDNMDYGDYEGGDVTDHNPDGTPSTPAEDLPIEEINFCEQNGVQKTFQIIGYLLFIAKIIVPLLLIIWGTIDFAKATISSDDKAPRDAVVALIRRIIIAVIIFFIPTILNFLLSLINGASEAFNDNGFSGCTDCLFDPFGDCEASDIGS